MIEDYNHIGIKYLHHKNYFNQGIHFESKDY